MSLVTNVLLHTGISEDVTLEQINAAVAPEQNGQEFRSLTDGTAADEWGGHKFPEMNLYAAAFNYLIKVEFYEAILNLPWSEPEYVQLFIQEQEDDILTKMSLMEMSGALARAMRYA